MTGMKKRKQESNFGILIRRDPVGRSAGLTITRGASFLDKSVGGAGIYIMNSSPTISDVTLSACTTVGHLLLAWCSFTMSPQAWACR